MARLPRWLVGCRARLLGYFWLPCPVCGEMFAGFEASYYSLKDASKPYSGWIVCSKYECKRAALDSWGNGPNILPT